MGPREVYEVTGDSATAMRLLVQGNNNHHEEEPPQQHPQEEYNCLLLSALATTTTTNTTTTTTIHNSNSNINNTISLLDDSLEDARKVVLHSYTNHMNGHSISSSSQPPTQRRRRKIMDEWILAYNRGLVLFAKGHIAASIRTAWTYLQPMILGVLGGDSGVAEPSSSPSPPLEWVCRMGFLLLEGMFTLYPTRMHGRTTSTVTAINNNNNDNKNNDDGSSSSFDLSLIDRVLSWLIENVEKTTAAPPPSLVPTVSSSSSDSRHNNNNNINNNNTDPTEEEDGTTPISPDPQLKFLLSLYKSRFDFFERTTEDALLRDKHMRSARKELKVAMEIFQHKLRPASSSAPSSASASEESLNSGEGGEGRESGTFNNSNSHCSSTAADAVSLASVSSYSEEVAAATAGHNTTTTITNNATTTTTTTTTTNNNDSSSSSSSSKQQRQTSSPTQTHTQTHTVSSNRPTTSSAVSSTPVPSTTAAAAAAFNNSNRQLSRILQGQNQAALNLKANAEQLKGNVKKSLILCGEAHSFNNNSTNSNNNANVNTNVNVNANATNSPPTSEHKKSSSGSSSSSSTSHCSNYYEAIHQNNLGIVYETSGNSHLALHAFSKAVRCASHAPYNTNVTNSTSTPRFDADGTARPDVTLAVLNNAAVCALKARNFSAAYDCYAIGLATSPVWRTRPRTWLRLSEACIGLNTNVKKERTERANQCSKVEIDGKAMGVLLTDTIQYQGKHHRTVTTLPALASSEDRHDIRQHALLRARMALETAVQLFGEEGANADPVAFQSARLSLAYIMLEEKNFKKALDYALLVLCHKEDSDQATSNNNNSNETTTTTPTARSDNNHHEGGEKTPPVSASAAAAAVVVEEDTVAFVHQTLLKRQQATARMYASEAQASLGDAMASMKLLVGDGKDDAFDRLSSDLGGVTMERAASHSTAKARLAKAQTMVRCSASAASAALGNVTASKQLAMSAQAMENSYSPSRAGTSQARKALIYCMLREGNHGAALTLLRSAR